MNATQKPSEAELQALRNFLHHLRPTLPLIEPTVYIAAGVEAPWRGQLSDEAAPTQQGVDDFIGRHHHHNGSERGEAT